MKKPIEWHKYPARTCRWLNECRLCGRHITSGQRYFDGGYGRRAHVICVMKLSEPSATAAESSSEPQKGGCDGSR